MKSVSKDNVLEWARYTAKCPECKKITQVCWNNIVTERANCSFCFKVFKIED